MNINERINNFKNSFIGLNPKEFYIWPMGIQVLIGFGIVLLIMVLGYVFDLSDQQDLFDRKVSEQTKLQDKFQEQIKKSVNLTRYKEQLIEIEKVSDNLLKQLPKSSEVDKLLLDINQAGVSKGLAFDLFKPGEEKLYDFYAELPIKIKVAGDFNSIGKFVADIGQLSRVVVLTDMMISNKENVINPTNLILEAEAKTFRYLDQVEIDTQRKIKEDAEKKKKKVSASEEEKMPKGH